MTDRTETGRIQFSDDWPGTFIRGDESLGYAQALHALLHLAEQRAKSGAMESVEAIYWARVRTLIGVLRQCDVRNSEPQRINS